VHFTLRFTVPVSRRHVVMGAAANRSMKPQSASHALQWPTRQTESDDGHSGGCNAGRANVSKSAPVLLKRPCHLLPFGPRSCFRQPVSQLPVPTLLCL
jgi:hypothetical protein